MLTEEEMFPEKARHRELVGLLAEIRDRLPSRARPVRLEIHGWPHPPASPETASGASESDAGPSEAAPEAPPAPERPSAGDPDEAGLLASGERDRAVRDKVLAEFTEEWATSWETGEVDYHRLVSPWRLADGAEGR